MHKFSLLSKILAVVSLFMSTMPMVSCSTVQSFEHFELFSIVQSTETRDNEKWAHYLYTHMNQRTSLPQLLTEKKVKDSKCLQVTLSFDTSMGKQYSIDYVGNEVDLAAGDNDVMLWLCYQFISKVAQYDSRFNADDLPPAAIDIKGLTDEFPFEFRGIYSPSNANEDMLAITASHHVDYNWALWGHNLWKTLGDTPDPDVYAKINGTTNTQQFCFSSNALYEAVENYIIDQWGTGDKDAPARFTIMPMDNKLVCTCSDCLKAGNDSTNATPAVSKMIVRLAERFPNHLFFTSAYATTAKRPTRTLPSNVGVLVSAMDMPMVADFRQTEAFADFDQNIEAWKKLTSRVYIWDYSQNFDNYLSPYPCLNIMQRRIQYYKEAGVSGIFINGSGEDYSLFDDIHTMALQALLINPDLDLNEYLAAAFARLYPQTNNILCPYYTALENKVADENIELPYYGGIDETLKYLDMADFNALRTALDKKSKSVNGEERSRLNKMLTALSFTTLEAMRLNDNPPTLDKATPDLEILIGYESFDDMKNTKEALGSLDTYMEQWNDDAQSALPSNIFKGQSLTSASLSASETERLTDGLLGFYSDYHLHWVVAKGEWNITLPASETKNLRLSLLNAPAWRIWMPQTIQLLQEGRVIATWNSQQASADRNLVERQMVDLSTSGADPAKPLQLLMTPADRPRATIGCDEIMGFN